MVEMMFLQDKTTFTNIGPYLRVMFDYQQKFCMHGWGVSVCL